MTVAQQFAERSGVRIAYEAEETGPPLFVHGLGYDRFGSGPLDGWQAQGAAALGFDGSERLSEIATPTLVLHGTADSVVDVRNADLLAAGIPGARLELLKDLGHLLFWEDPERFARVVEEFPC